MAANAASWSSYENALAEAVGRRCGLDPARDPYPAVLVAAVLAVVRTLSVRWQEFPGAPLVEVLGQAFDSLARGLPPPQPHESSRGAAPMTTTDPCTVRPEHEES